MPIVGANKIKYDDADPSKRILDALGDVSDLEVFNNLVLVAIYTRPEKTRGGIHIPGAARDEDKYQSKVGLIVAKGPSAFVDDGGKWFKDANVQIGDWVTFRPSDGAEIEINDVRCRWFSDTSIKGRIPSPDIIW